MKARNFVTMMFCLLLLLCSNNSVGAASVQEANVFQLTGVGINVTYSATGLDGKPTLSYRDKKLNVTFRGDEVSRLETHVGLQVTVVLEEIPDLHTVTFTLLLPRVNVDESEMAFKTYGIITTHRTSVGGPGLVKGPLQIYNTRPLRGIAQRVLF